MTRSEKLRERREERERRGAKIRAHVEYRPWTLWSCTEARRRQINDVRRLVGLEDIPRWDWGYRPVKPRNYFKHPRTATELANRQPFYLRNHFVLEFFMSMTRSSMKIELWQPVYTC
jgi:hypothetical protein